MDTLLLASSSPRRKDLLALLGIPFVTIHPEIDESVFDHFPPDRRVVALAERKADQGRRLYRDSSPPAAGPRFILAADTLVALPNAEGWEVIGKPDSADQAAEMLARLQGRTQEVYTGVCVENLASGVRHLALSRSLVSFAPMSGKEILRYIETGEWEGAAGAYRIQGWGSCYIESIEGSPSGVMGLPLRELYGILSAAGFDFGS